MARYAYGSVVRLSGKTYVKDLSPKIQEYLREIGHERSVLGDAEVWVRYSDQGSGLPGRRGGCAYPEQVGPTRESVERHGEKHGA